MYFERPFKIDGVFFAIIDGEKIEISREVAKAMLSFYLVGEDSHLCRW